MFVSDGEHHATFTNVVIGLGAAPDEEKPREA
jgi:hypothetical protein